ncbi:MAG: serine hydrolase, partial [Planctomycetaceae bacterium]
MRHLPATVLLFLITLPVSLTAKDIPRAIAHRGLFKHAPENTLAAFRSCLAVRAGFEVDVQRAQDGPLVCIHDETVDRTTDGRGRVSELSLKQLRQLDAGGWFGADFRNERIPTFAEVAQLIRTNGHTSTLIAIDLKASGIEADLVAAASRAGILDQLLFIGSAIRSKAVRAGLRAADPTTHVACLANNPGQLLQAIDDENSDWVYFRYLPSPAETARVKSAGKQSFIAGPAVAGQQPVHWKRTLYSSLNAVLTDYPLELTGLIREVQHNAALYVTDDPAGRVVRPLTSAEPETVDISSQKLQTAVSLIRRSIDNDELRGAVLFVARRGKVVLHTALGYRDSERSVPLQKDALFRMASNSKAITAAGLLTLVQDGLIGLDDPVSRYLPAFSGDKSRQITIRQLLTHTSGLRIPTLFLDPLLQPDDSLNSQLIREVSRFGEIGAAEPPGTSYAYSNAGYNTLAGVIEAVTGSYTEHLKSSLYAPLGMNDSCNHESVADHARMSGVFRQADDGTWETRWKPGDEPDWPFARGSGGMVSTAADYAAFCQMILHSGTFDGRQILSEDLVRQATNPQNRQIAAAAGYGLGWVVSEDGGRFSHSGSDGTWVWVDPQLELIGMVLTQTQTKMTPRKNFRDLVVRACTDVPQPEPSIAGAHAEGFYKDIFMSSGVRLSSRKTLHAADSTQLTYEYYAGQHVTRQNQILVGTPDDTNGVLLHPDGQPRFRMIYVNGGGATAHGKSLTTDG